jgi:hypothetical protein
MILKLRHLAIACVATMVVAVSGCSPEIGIRPTKPSFLDSEIPRPSAEVFEAFLRVAQEQNLSIRVTEKASGALQFENANLSSAQLERYCLYPEIYTENGGWGYEQIKSR